MQDRQARQGLYRVMMALVTFVVNACYTLEEIKRIKFRNLGNAKITDRFLSVKLVAGTIIVIYKGAIKLAAGSRAKCCLCVKI